MPTITADSAMAAQLSGAKSLLEINDAQGRRLGTFTPDCPDDIRLYLSVWLSIDPIEIKRRKATKEKTFTTAEVLEHLRTLEAS